MVLNAKTGQLKDDAELLYDITSRKWSAAVMKSGITEKIYEENLIEYMARVNMTPRDKEIVQIYLSEKPTYRELGERYGLSHERIRQLLTKFARKAHHYYSLDQKMK